MARRDHGAPQPSSYVELKRTWKIGDTVELDDAEDRAPRADAGQSDGRGDHVGAARARGRSRPAPRGTRAAQPPPAPVPVLVDRGARR